MKKRLKEIFIKVIDIFEKNNLNYFVIGGTLLGTVRHEDFIPWDDDIDIGMPRTDYDKLINLVKNNKIISEKISFNFKETRADYKFSYGKVYDEFSTLIEGDIRDNLIGGVYIDIFPLDVSTRDLKKTEKTLLKIKRNIRYLNLKSKSKSSNKIKTIIKFLSQPLIKVFISEKRIYRKNMQIIKKGNQLYEPQYIVNYFGAWGIKEIYNYSYFSEYIIKKFSNINVRVPIGYHEILEKTYGDYMKLPPVEKRVSHHTYYLDLNTPYKKYNIERK